MDVVAGVDDLIESADVIAMLMSADHVIEAVRRLHADRLEVRDDVLRPHAGVAALEKDGDAGGTFDEDGSAPADVDVMDLQGLREEWEGNQKQHGYQTANESHASSPIGRLIEGAARQGWYGCFGERQ